MRFPIQGTTFMLGFYVAKQFQNKIFPRFCKGYYNNADGYVRPEHYLNNKDLISRFRFFEHGEATADTKSEIQNYLDLYTEEPLTKYDLLSRYADGKPLNADYAKNF